MSARLALALLALAPALASAQVPTPPVKVEPRLLSKQGHVFGSASGTWFARGDYYNNPGVGAQLAWYLSEAGGPELVGRYFFSSLTDAGLEVYEKTGLVPDAHQPVAQLSLGWRQSLGYGKLLVGTVANGVAHFDVQLAGHAGVLKTNRAWAPMLDLGPAVVVRLAPNFFAHLDVGAAASWEPRRRHALALGLLPAIGIGGWL